MSKLKIASSNHSNVVFLAQCFSQVRGQRQWEKVLHDLLTPAEQEALADRIKIVARLFQGQPQRMIARELKVSLFLVTHAAKILKQEVGGLTQLLLKG